MLERLARLFSGYENIYGQYSTDNAVHKENGKLEGSAWTQRGAPDWKKHVEGKVGLGIIPLRIDNTLYFGVIDVDVYKGLSHMRLCEKISSLGLPLVVCRSKSGGAHLYVFFSEPVAAHIAVDKLNEWATTLGHGGSEIFPKQVGRASPNDIGNWINIPYFGGDLTQRYAYDAKGKQLNLREFLNYAESKMISPKELKALDFTPVEEEENDLLKGAPPCMCQALSQGGFPEGTRNDSMFNVGIFARKKWPDEWQSKIEELNDLLCDPPIDEYEMKQLVKSLEKRETYEMRCNGPFCNKKKCRTVAFGRGPLYSDVGVDIGSVTKVEGDEAAWYIEVNERRVKMTTKHLMSQGQFNLRTVETINIVTQPLPYQRWLQFIQEAILSRADIVQLPREATWDGQFWHRFTQFMHSMGLQASSVEEILIGKVWSEKDDALFLPMSLFEFLNETRFKYDSPEQIWAALLDHGVKRDKVRISHREIEVWKIKKPEELRPEVRLVQQKQEF